MVYKDVLSASNSKIIEISLFGLQKGFPENNFSVMTRSGAKGSKVNHA